MRQLTKRFACSGFIFSGMLITASTGLCQEPFRWPAAKLAAPAPTAKQVTWDQLPGLAAKPVSHAKAPAQLLGPSDFVGPKRPGMLPDVVVATNVPGHNATNGKAVKKQSHKSAQAESIDWADLGPRSQEASGLIGPNDMQPRKLTASAETMPVPQTPWQSSPPAVTSPRPPQFSKVSLLPITAAQGQETQMQATQVQEITAAEAPIQPSPSDRTSEEPKTFVLQDVRKPEQQVQSQPETLIPIDILPFNRLISADTAMAANMRYNTAEMTGPMTDATILFSQLDIEDDYRNETAVPLGDVRTVPDASGYGPEWIYQDYAWVSPAFYHKPLYFEQPNLERYGIGPRRKVQPFYSAAHFFCSLGLMPYKMLTQHPCEHVYTLGNRRPGDCVPYQKRSLLGQSYPFEAFRYFHDSNYR